MIYDVFIFTAWCVVFWTACRAAGRGERRALLLRARAHRINALERWHAEHPVEEYDMVFTLKTTFDRSHVLLSNITED